MSAKKSTIFIHIGTIKTGTTSLQNFFHINRVLLAEEFNIYYPKSPGLQNHTRLPLYAYDGNVTELRARHNISSEEQLAKFRKEFISKFCNEIESHIETGRDILLSSEHLSSRATERAEIEKLLSLFEAYDVNCKVIVYLRRQDKMMLSTYSTWVKSGGRWQLNPTAYKNRRYNHLEMIQLWASVVGKENMIVKVFEKSRMKNGDLYDDFTDAIGIRDLSKLTIPKKANLNTALDQEQIQFLTLFNKFVPSMNEGSPNKDRGEIISFLEEFSTDNKLDISQEDKRNIYKHFEADNNRIAKEYIKNGQPLFDPITSEKEVLKPIKLTPEKAVEIASYLWIKQQQQINSKPSLGTQIKKSLKKIFML